MGDVGTHTDLDMDMNYSSDLDPHIEAHNMLMKGMAALNYDPKNSNFLVTNIRRKHSLYSSCNEE